MSLIIKAAQFAAECHEAQTRKYTGQPYITHPIRVAGRVATHPAATDELVAAAYLHDVVEDCEITFETIRESFGEEVESYVKQLTNTSKESGENRATRKAMDRERIKGISNEAKIVKLIDRIDNLREIDVNDHFAVVYAEESRALVDESIGPVDVGLYREVLTICNGLTWPV